MKVLLLLLAALLSPGAGTPEAPPAVETPVGMEGNYYLRASDRLEAKPVEEKAPLTLRIARVVEDRGAFVYDLRFIGTRAGRHDLAASLRRADGGDLSGLEPMPVLVKEGLPPDHQGELEPFAGPPPARPWRLREWLWAAAALWALPFLWSIGTRLLRPRPPPAAAPPARPTLADRLRPLVEAAIAGRLPPEGKARLERMLIAHWRSRLGLAEMAPAEALRSIREHGEAGLLLERLEGWLHRRPGGQPVDLEALLSPYQGELPAAAARELSSEASS